MSETHPQNRLGYARVSTVGQTLEAQLDQLKAAGLIFHSDCSRQYASGDFQRQLKAFGMKGSMSRKGGCWDNAVTETLFASLKVEHLHDMRFATRRQAKDEVMDWLEFDNNKRLHSTLGYFSLMAFERKRLAEEENSSHDRTS